MNEFEIMSFEEYAAARKTYSDNYECFVYGCHKPGWYEGGDARFHCGMCEEHSGIRRQYEIYRNDIIRRINVRKLVNRITKGK